jgi:hypothetical protein
MDKVQKPTNYRLIIIWEDYKLFFQVGREAHPASYPLGAKGSFPKDKAARV